MRKIASDFLSKKYKKNLKNGIGLFYLFIYFINYLTKRTKSN